MIRLEVLGRVTVDAGGGPWAPQANRKTLALLGWLAVHPGPQPRVVVASALWPDVLETSALRSLRTALWTLRGALADSAAAVVATRDRVGLDPERLRVDLWEFEALAAAGELDAAVALCEGELLPGVEEEWALRARDAHRERVAELLDALAQRCAGAGDVVGAAGWARRRSALDPYSEEGARALMRRLADAGDRPAALGVFARLVERLRSELGVAVSPETIRLERELRAAAAPSRSSVRGRLPLVGRACELEALTEAWGAACGGVGGVALVRGPAGIGKTRLVAELADHVGAAGALVAGCAAPDLGMPAPFALWAELAGDLVRGVEAPRAAAGWTADLAGVAPAAEAWVAGSARRAPATPELARMRLFEGMLSLVEHAARQTPVLLVLEDVDAADISSLELIGYVARRLPAHRALAVLTRREPPRRLESASVEHALRARDVVAADLVLAPLTSGDLRAVATSVARLPDRQLSEIVAAAEGSPLLAVEAARALARGEPSLSGGLRGAVRAALVGLGSGGRQLVELAAVAGRELSVDEVLPMLTDCSAEGFATAVAAAEGTGLVECAHGRIAFGHALLCAAAYGDVPELRRAALHERVADALADGGDATAAERAAHLRLAGRTDDAVPLLVRAATRARRVAAHAEAEDFLTEAAALRPLDAAIALDLAEVQISRDRQSASRASFEHAVELLQSAGDLRALAQAHFRRGRWHYTLVCVPRLAAQELRLGLDVLEAAGEDLGADGDLALAGMAWVEALSGDPQRAEGLVDELESRGAAAEPLVAVELGRARATALIRRGRAAESHEFGVQAAVRAQRAGRPDLAYGCWANSAGAAAAVGDFSRALNYLDRCLAGVRGRGLWTIESQTLCARAWVLARHNRLEEAESAAREAESLADRVGADALLATAQQERARIALAAGQWAEAERLFASALGSAGSFSRPLARLGRAEALARLGRRDEATRELRNVALEPVTAGDWPDTLVAHMARVEGLIAAAAGDRDAAVARLEAAAAGWRRRIGADDMGASWAAALADLGRPVVGVVEPALELERVLADLRRFDAIPMTTEV